MKKLVICAILFAASMLCGHKAAAQFMISAGYDRTQYTLNDTRNGNPFDGFSAEVGYTAKFAKNVLGFSFGLGYQFSTRRDADLMVGDLGVSVSSQEQHLTLPLRFVIDIPMGKVGLVLYAGGYGAYALSGMKTYEFGGFDFGSVNLTYDYLRAVTDANEDIPQDIVSEISGKLDGYKMRRYDYGIQGGAGFRLGNSVMLQGLYNYGFCDRNPKGTSGRNTRGGFAVRLAFLM